jgi:hypothetical protein
MPKLPVRILIVEGALLRRHRRCAACGRQARPRGGRRRARRHHGARCAGDPGAIAMANAAGHHAGPTFDGVSWRLAA